MRGELTPEDRECDRVDRSARSAMPAPNWRGGTISTAVLLIVLLGAPIRFALAAPFCVTTAALPPQCLYVDPSECRERAVQLHGICAANPAEFQITPGVAPYCVVDATRYAFCAYTDLDSCNLAADRRPGAVCLMAPTTSPGVEANPMRR